jgi:hypothetical protein
MQMHSYIKDTDHYEKEFQPYRMDTERSYFP